MKRFEILPIVLAATLSFALLVGCSTNAADTGEAEPSSSADEATSAASTEGATDVPSPEGKVLHRMAIGETVHIHGFGVKVTSAKDGPESVDGKPTYVIRVDIEAVQDPSYYGANGAKFSPTDWSLEYANGETSGEVAMVSAAALGDVTMYPGDEVEGNIYLVKTGNVSKIVYWPSMFDWYPEVTTWDVP